MATEWIDAAQGFRESKETRSLLKAWSQTTSVLIDGKTINVPDVLIAPESRVNHKVASLEGSVYTKIGHEGMTLVASPAVVHFSGYALHQVHSQRLKVINISRASTRLLLIPPSTPMFRIQYEKKGLLAPGMSEDVSVEFIPSEWRYHYDCIRVHSDSENIIIPIHAYPVVNESIFPTRIEMGVCPISETCSKVVPLRCTVPVHFEFDIAITKPHPAFSISPLKGIIPGNGHVDITINYHPSSLSTAFLELTLNVSQFNFEPLKCTVSGSSAPGLVMASILGQSTVGLPLDPPFTTLKDDPSPAAHASLTATATATLARALKMTWLEGGQRPALVEMGGGAGHGDPYTRVQALLSKGKRHMRTSSKGIDGSPLSDKEEVFEGLRMPKSSLQGHATISYVLNQKKGKMNMKQLKEALVAMSNKEKQGDGDGDGRRGESPDNSRQYRELMFEREFRRVEEFEKSKDLKWFVSTGEKWVTEEACRAVIDERQVLKALRHQAQLSSALGRVTSQALPPQQDHMRRWAHPPEDTSWHKPTWDHSLSHTFRKRARVLQRLRKVCIIVVMRIRANRIIRRLNHYLQSVGLLACAETNHSADRPGSPNQAQSTDNEDDKAQYAIDLRKMHGQAFPTLGHENMLDPRPVHVREVAELSDSKPFPLQVPQHYKMLGYKPCEPHPLHICMPTQSSRRLLIGALEEEPIRASRGRADQLFTAIPAPEALFSPLPQPPHMRIHLKPPLEVHMPLLFPPETSLHHTLWPKHPLLCTSSSTIAEPVGLCTWKALANQTTLSDVWLPRRERPLESKGFDDWSHSANLLEGPQADDMKQLQYGSLLPTDEFGPSELHLLIPTPESIATAFNLPIAADGSGEMLVLDMPVTRENERLYREQQQRLDEREVVRRTKFFEVNALVNASRRLHVK